MFTKRFPRTSKTSVYPRWVDVSLTDEEETAVEEEARKKNIQLLKQCIDEANEIVKDKHLKYFQSDLIHLAVALFDKRASHQVFWKEEKAREKIEKLK